MREKEHMKARTCLVARERQKKRSMKAPQDLQTVHRNGDVREVLIGCLKRSAHRIQSRGDARVQGMSVGTRRVQERSVRIRRAIGADRSANDTAKQATMTRETDISAEQWCAKEKPIFTDSRPRCCKLSWSECTHREPTTTKWRNAE